MPHARDWRDIVRPMDQTEFGLEPALEDPIGTTSPALQRILAQLRLKPEVAEYQYDAGVEYRSLGRADWAIRYFEQAVRLKSNFDLAHVALADLLLLSGQLEQAKRHAETACAISPSNKEWETALALVLEAGREYDRAYEIIDRLLAGGYRSPQLVLLAAQVAPRREAAPEALDLIVDALRPAGWRGIKRGQVFPSLCSRQPSRSVGPLRRSFSARCPGKFIAAGFVRWIACRAIDRAVH
jgi:tetratricopeptide (TPR) repeat protein